MWQLYLNTNIFIETLPNGTKHLAAYNSKGTLKNTKNIKFLEIIIF